MKIGKGSLLLFVLTVPVFAAQRPGATFLLIPPSARATGMAYAYTAMSNDASANYYNAAGLAFFESPKITTTYSGYLPGLHPDMYYLYFGFAYPLVKSTWGFDVFYFTPGYNRHMNFDSTRSYRLILKLNYARILFENLSFGIGWKFIHQISGPDWIWIPELNIGIDRDGTGSSFAFDFNCLYKILPNLSFGTVLHNIGPDIKYTETGSSNPIPRLFRLGAAYKPLDNEYIGCTISTEITKMLVGMFAIEENSFWENLKYEIEEAWKGIGLEFTFYKAISLRGGYFLDKEGKREGFTFGAGINIKNFGIDIGIDEHIFDFLTQNRKISLSYTF